MPTVTCRCGFRLEVNEDVVGLRLRCPNCRQRFRIVASPDWDEESADAQTTREPADGASEESPPFEYAQETASAEDKSALREGIEPPRKKRER